MQNPPAKNFWIDVTRIVSVEFAQNWPILAGILLATGEPSLLTSVFLTLLGAFLSALCISLTDPLKYAQRPGAIVFRDLVNNTVIFGSAGLLYVGYYRLIRSDNRGWIDPVFGLALGLSIGLLQAKFVDERRMNRAALFHALAIGFSGGLILTLLGVLAAACPPLLSASLLDVPMTLIIVWMDYRHLFSYAQTV